MRRLAERRADPLRSHVRRADDRYRYVIEAHMRERVKKCTICQSDPSRCVLHSG